MSEITVGSRVSYIGEVDSHRGCTGTVMAIQAAPAALNATGHRFPPRAEVAWEAPGPRRTLFGDDVSHEVVVDIDKLVLIEEPTLTHEELAEDLARWSGEAAARAQAEECERTACTCDNCVDRARSDADRDEYAFVMGLPLADARARHKAELDERCVARARREGVLPPA